MPEQLQLDQAIVVSGFTGYLACSFSELHADVIKRLGRPVWTHEFPGLREQIKEAYRADFLAMCAPGTPMPGD